MTDRISQIAERMKGATNGGLPPLDFKVEDVRANFLDKNGVEADAAIYRKAEDCRRRQLKASLEDIAFLLDEREKMVNELERLRDVVGDEAAALIDEVLEVKRNTEEA